MQWEVFSLKASTLASAPRYVVFHYTVSIHALTENGTALPGYGTLRVFCACPFALDFTFPAMYVAETTFCDPFRTLSSKGVSKVSFKAIPFALRARSSAKQRLNDLLLCVMHVARRNLFWRPCVMRHVCGQADVKHVCWCVGASHFSHFPARFYCPLSCVFV